MDYEVGFHRFSSRPDRNVLLIKTLKCCVARNQLLAIGFLVTSRSFPHRRAFLHFVHIQIILIENMMQRTRRDQKYQH